MSVAEPLPYRSPMKKLLRFFERSRNQWKSKCQDGQTGEQEPEDSLGQDESES